MFLLNTGNFNGKYGDKFELNLYYTYTQETVENKTDIILYLYWKSLGYAGNGSNSTGYINGVAVGQANRISTNENKLLGTLSITIKHNEDGSFPDTPYDAIIDTPWTLGDASVSGVLTSNNIPNIARISPVTATDTNIESAMSININRAVNTFKHTLRYKFGSLEGTIAENVDTNYGWIVPNSFYKEIPNSASGVGTIFCDTYKDDTLLGTSQASFKAYADPEKCRPEVSVVVVDVNETTLSLTGDENKIVKGVSNVKITIDATALNSSTLKTKVVTSGDGKTGTGDEVIINGVESPLFIIEVTDSRNFTTRVEVTKDFVDYIPLTLNATFNRTTPTTGEVTLKVEGNYFNGSFGATNNNLTVQYRSKESYGDYTEYTTITPVINDNKYTIDVILEGFDYRKTFDFEIIAFDKTRISNPAKNTAHVAEGIPMMALFKSWIEMFGVETFKNVDDVLQINKELTIGDTGKTLNDIFTKTNSIPQPIVIYENSTGSSSEVTLSENKENFKFIEFYYIGNGNRPNCKKIVIAGGKQTVSLNTFWQIDETGAMQFEAKDYYIENNKMTPVFNKMAYINIFSAENIQVYYANSIKITKIIGYR